jgi:hypothetical protein
LDEGNKIGKGVALSFGSEDGEVEESIMNDDEGWEGKRLKVGEKSGALVRRH